MTDRPHVVIRLHTADGIETDRGVTRYPPPDTYFTPIAARRAHIHDDPASPTMPRRRYVLTTVKHLGDGRHVAHYEEATDD